MATKHRPTWLRTVLATLVGVAVWAVLAFAGAILMSLAAWLFIYGDTLTFDPLTTLLGNMVVFVFAVGFVFLARFIASRLSGGKASLPTTLIAGALTLYIFGRILLRDLARILGQ